jgi:hypothetical protein
MLHQIKELKFTMVFAWSGRSMTMRREMIKLENSKKLTCNHVADPHYGIVVKSLNPSRSRGHGARMFPVPERKRERERERDRGRAADSIMLFLRMRVAERRSFTHSYTKQLNATSNRAKNGTFVSSTACRREVRRRREVRPRFGKLRSGRSCVAAPTVHS